MTARIFAGLLAVVALAGCEPEPAASQFCDYFCACTLTLPSEQRACVLECSEDIGAGFPEPCAECILGLECAPDLEARLDQGACAQSCGGL